MEATVAQPIEAQVIGVDKMIYMKSNSGNDGSYGLTVSFELGTNPDINTVNVNNRVQAALAKLPQEVQRERRDGAEALLRDPGVPPVLQRGRQAGPAVHQQLRHHQRARSPVAHAGRGQAFLFGKLDYSMRIWFDTNRLTSLNLAPSDIIRAIQQQNVQAPVGPHRRAADLEDQQFQLNVQTQGRLTTPEQFGDIVLRANPDGSVLRVRDVARVELGAANMDTESRLNGNPAVSIGVYLAPGRQCGADLDARAGRRWTSSRRAFPPGLHAAVFYDSSTFVSRHHPRGASRRSPRPSSWS